VKGTTAEAEFLHTFDHIFWFGDFNYRVDLGDHGTLEEFTKVLDFIGRSSMSMARGSAEVHLLQRCKSLSPSWTMTS
jgi:hypothetical protein